MNPRLHIPKLDGPFSPDEAEKAIDFLKSCTIAFACGRIIDGTTSTPILAPFHYDLMKACGARMDDLVRGPE